MPPLWTQERSRHGKESLSAAAVAARGMLSRSSLQEFSDTWVVIPAVFQAGIHNKPDAGSKAAGVTR